MLNIFLDVADASVFFPSVHDLLPVSWSLAWQTRIWCGAGPYISSFERVVVSNAHKHGCVLAGNTERYCISGDRESPLVSVHGDFICNCST